MDDRGKRLVLTLFGILLLFYAFTPDPLPVAIDNLLAGVLGFKLIAKK